MTETSRPYVTLQGQGHHPPVRLSSVSATHPDTNRTQRCLTSVSRIEEATMTRRHTTSYQQSLLRSTVDDRPIRRNSRRPITTNPHKSESTDDLIAKSLNNYRNSS